jgi:hypothetical protein
LRAEKKRATRGEERRERKGTYLFQSNFDFSKVFNLGAFKAADIAINPPPLALFGGTTFLATSSAVTMGASAADAVEVEGRGASIEGEPNRASIADVLVDGCFPCETSDGLAVVDVVRG